jgi:hypothetical protein
MQTSLAAPRAAVYRGLAQFLAGDEPPPWLADPGSGWPFYQDVLRLADHSAASRTAAQAMEDVPASSWVDLTEDYQTLLVQTEPPYFLFYESTWLSGRILGPQVFSVASFYRSAGLEVCQTMLPWSWNSWQSWQKPGSRGGSQSASFSGLMPDAGCRAWEKKFSIPGIRFLPRSAFF